VAWLRGYPQFNLRDITMSATNIVDCVARFKEVCVRPDYIFASKNLQTDTLVRYYNRPERFVAVSMPDETSPVVIATESFHGGVDHAVYIYGTRIVCTEAICRSPCSRALDDGEHLIVGTVVASKGFVFHPEYTASIDCPEGLLRPARTKRPNLVTVDGKSSEDL
jgi:hypothetical protein